MPSKPTVGASTDTWGTELNAFLDAALNTDGTLKDTYRSTHPVRYVDAANGNDSNDGQTPYRAFATIQAAYVDLPDGDPASGNVATATLILLPGNHNVSGGMTIDAFKPVIMTSAGGLTSWRWPYSGTLEGETRIYSSSSIDALITIAAAPSGTHNNYGCQFSGLTFDLSTGTSFGVHGYNANKVTIQNCHAAGASSPSIAQFLGRSEIDTSHGDDASWWRFLQNSTYHAGLHKAGNFASSPAENCNQHVWAFNQINAGALIEPPIYMWGGTRCLSIGNNIEGTGSVAGISIEQTRQCAFIGDGGENVNPFINAIGTTNNNGNLFAPLGITASQSGKSLVTDGNPKRNRHLTDFVGWQVGYAESTPVTASKTGTYTVNQYDQLVRCDSTSAGFTATLPTASNAFGEVHVVRNYGTANTVTVASAGGTITGITALGAGGFGTYISDGTNWYGYGNAGVAGTASWARTSGTYSTSVTPAVGNLSVWAVTASDTVAFAINAPTGMVDGQLTVFVITNSSGGTLGNVTWNAAFQTTWSNGTDKPANGHRTLLTFIYNSAATTWFQTGKQVDLS